MNRKGLIAGIQLSVTLFAGNVAAGTPTEHHGPMSESPEAPRPVSTVESIIASGRAWIGTPYRYGGTSSRGIDCSALMQRVFADHGVQIPRSSLAIHGATQRIARSEVRPGDVLFFRGRNSASARIGHIALVTSVEDGKTSILHATRRGVVEDVLEESSYYRTRYLGAGRIMDFDVYELVKAAIPPAGTFRFPGI